MPGQPSTPPAARGRDELARVVEGYAPAGEEGQRTDAPITAGYDNAPGA